MPARMPKQSARRWGIAGEALQNRAPGMPLATTTPVQYEERVAKGRSWNTVQDTGGAIPEADNESSGHRSKRNDSHSVVFPFDPARLLS